MLLWPTVSALGFLLLVGLVVALALRSTEQYDVERGRVGGRHRTAPAPAATAVPAASAALAVDGVHPSAGPVGPGPEAPDPVAAGHAPGRLEASGSVATLRQARPVDGGSTPAWWLVTEGDHRVVSGPFPDRVEADWALLTGPATARVHAVYGVHRPDGELLRRQSPEELAWLSDLGDQLDRLPQVWDEWFDDDDPMVTLVVEVAAALVESGLPLHDCVGDGTAGGVCLTPEPGCDGVLVSWHQHDRMSRDHVRGADAVAAVQRTMNAAAAECLEQLGFLVAPVGSSGCSLVIDARPAR